MPPSPSPISPTTMPRASNDSAPVSVHVRAPTPQDGERTVPEAESASQRRHSSPQWLQWLTPAHFAPLAHFKQHAKRLSWGNGSNAADPDKEQASSPLTGDAAEPGGAPAASASASVSASIASATSQPRQGGAPCSSRTSPRRAPPRAQTLPPAPVVSALAVVKPDPNVTNSHTSQSHPSQPRFIASIPQPPPAPAAMPTAQAHLTPGSSEVPLLDPSPDLGTSPLPSLDTASRKHAHAPPAPAGEADIPSPSPGLAHDAVVARFLRPRRPTPQRSMTAPTTPTPSSPNPDANSPGHPLARSTSGGPGVPEPDDERDVADILDGPLEPGGGRVTRALGAQIDAVLKAQDEIGAAHLALEGIGRRMKTKDGKGELKEDAGEDELERRKRGVEQIMQKLSVLSTSLKTYHALGTPALVFPSKRDDGPPIPTAKIAHPAIALPVVPTPSGETDTLPPVRVGGAGFSAPVIGPKSAPAFAETLVASPDTIAAPPPAPSGRRGSRKTSLDLPRAPIPTTTPAPPPLTTPLPPLSLNTKAKGPLSPLSPSSAQRAAAAWLDRGVPKKATAPASPASEKNMHERPW